MRLAETLAKNLQTNPQLQQCTFYIIPRPSPDAAESFFARPYHERATNTRPTDDDRDGRLDEDAYEDLNNDGFITMLRVHDSTGTHMVHPDDKRVLIEVDPAKNEQGQFRLYTEGIDNDKDGKFNEDGPGGVDFNRNFTFKYPYFKPGAGPNQISEPESRAVADFIYDQKHIALVFSFSVHDNLSTPWKADSRTDKKRIKQGLLSQDAPYFDFISEQYREIHKLENPADSPEPDGSFVHWAYFHYGRFSFAARPWWVTKPEKPKDNEDKKPAPDKEPQDREEQKEQEKPKEKRGRTEVNQLKWLKAHDIDGFVPWTAVKHPDFPGKKVEVGGFKPFVLLNPPADQLDPLAEKQFVFIKKLVGYLPQVNIAEVTAEPLGGQVYRLTARIVNQGYFPTIAAMGDTSRVPFPLQIELELPKDAKLIKGHARVLLKPLAGKGGSVEHSWLLRTKATSLRMQIMGPSIGADSKTVKLK